MSIYNVREHTAKTVNQELHSLVKSLEKIERRLLGKPGDKTLTELKAKQQAALDAAIVAAKEGRTWRHRGQVAHMNNGIRKGLVMAPVWDHVKDAPRGKEFVETRY